MSVLGRLTPGFSFAIAGSFHLVILPRKMSAMVGPSESDVALPHSSTRGWTKVDPAPLMVPPGIEPPPPPPLLLLLLLLLLPQAARPIANVAAQIAATERCLITSFSFDRFQVGR